ncbi:MAG: hypothetical protein CVU39_20895 [Chloroflexi bacterium HGW-Chloroflexi-10]|nr:MAG: hypothetical protein CVU39_20895 [Chloroflexi bacterium HGW-Chloroflexi-10]
MAAGRLARITRKVSLKANSLWYSVSWQALEVYFSKKMYSFLSFIDKKISIGTNVFPGNDQHGWGISVGNGREGVIWPIFVLERVVEKKVMIDE